MKQRKKKSRGVNLTLSPEAHQKMLDDAYKAKPRRSLRQQGNIINNLQIDL